MPWQADLSCPTRFVFGTGGHAAIGDHDRQVSAALYHGGEVRWAGRATWSAKVSPLGAATGAPPFRFASHPPMNSLK
jgi:hypothetical protein